MQEPLRLRATSAAVAFWCVIGVCALAAASLLIQADLLLALAVMGVPALIAAIAWMLYRRPEVVLARAGVRVKNIVSTEDVPFAEIAAFDLRMGMTLELRSGEKISAWALPSTGRRIVREGLRRARVEARQSPPIEAVLAAQRAWKAGEPFEEIAVLEHEGRPVGERAPDEPPIAERRSARTWWPVAVCAAAAVWAVFGLSVIGIL